MTQELCCEQAQGPLGKGVQQAGVPGPDGSEAEPEALKDARWREREGPVPPLGRPAVRAWEQQASRAASHWGGAEARERSGAPGKGALGRVGSPCVLLLYVDI